MLRSIRQISQQLKYVSKSSGTASMPSQRVTSVMQARTYKDFGHKEPKEPLISKCYYAFVTFSIIGLMLNWDAYVNFVCFFSCILYCVIC